MFRKSSLLVALLINFSGCAALWGGAENPYAGQQGYFYHSVRHQGETLGIIANWYTGAPANWKVIVQENPQVDILRIRLGDQIRIPIKMVKKRENLPLQFVLKNVEKPKSAPSTTTIAQERQPRGTVRIQPASATGKFPYRVNTVNGCEDLDNSAAGLESCIRRIEQKSA